MNRTEKLTGLGLVLNEAEGYYGKKDIVIEVETIESIDDAGFENLINQVHQFMLEHPGEYLHDQPTQELTVIDKASQTLQLAGGVLMALQAKSSLAATKARELIERIRANGDKLNDLLDKECNNFLNIAAERAKEVEETYKPITTTMDIIRGEFLDCKKVLDVKDKSSPFFIIQEYRNKWALECKREAERLAKEAQDKKNKADSIIKLTAEIEKRMSVYFNNYVFSKKQQINDRFNKITLSNFEDEKRSFSATPFPYAKDHFDQFSAGITSWPYCDITDIYNTWGAIPIDVRYTEFSASYKKEVENLLAICSENMQSKYNELVRQKELADQREAERMESDRIKREQATASAERRKQLEAEAEDNRIKQQETLRRQREEQDGKERRQDEENKRLADEEAKRRQQQQQNIEIKASQAATLNLFNSTMEQANTSLAAPKTKTVLKAAITNTTGVFPIFTLWFENVGKDMTPDELMKKLDFMFTYASKRANAAKLPLQVENQFVTYIEDVKAVKEKIKEVEGE